MRQVLVDRHARHHQAHDGRQTRQGQGPCAVGIEAHVFFSCWGCVLVCGEGKGRGWVDSFVGCGHGRIDRVSTHLDKPTDPPQPPSGHTHRSIHFHLPPAAAPKSTQRRSSAPSRPSETKCASSSREEAITAEPLASCSSASFSSPGSRWSSPLLPVLCGWGLIGAFGGE